MPDRAPISAGGFSFFDFGGRFIDVSEKLIFITFSISWDALGTLLGPLLGPLGSSLGVLGAPLGALGTLLGSLGGSLGFPRTS